MTVKTPFLKLTVSHDPDLENPCDNDGWKLYSLSRRHASFKEPAELGLDPFIPTPRDAKLKRRLKNGLAFWLSYFEHGQCLWMLKEDEGRRATCPDWRWDGVTHAGLLVWEQPWRHLGPRTYEDRFKDAKAFVETYTAWCNGEGVWFAVEDAEGETLASCGGFHRLEDAWEAIREAIPDEAAGLPIVVEGDLADSILAYHADELEGHRLVDDEDDLSDE